MEPTNLKPTPLGNFFFWTHSILTMIALCGGLLFLVMGSLFFDDPNASYAHFFWSAVGFMLITGLLFSASLFFRTKKLFSLSTGISFLTTLAVILYIGFIIMQAQGAKNSNQQALLTPAPDRFVCVQENRVISLVLGTDMNSLPTIHVNDSYWQDASLEEEWTLGTIDPKTKIFTSNPEPVSRIGSVPADVLTDTGRCLNSEGKTFSATYTQAQ